MSRKNGEKVMEGQVEIFDLSIDSSMKVRQANALVTGKQDLKRAKSIKLVRAAMMQIKEDDKEISPYVVSISDLSELFGTRANNLYRDIDNITNEIVHSAVHIKEYQNNKPNWKKIPWVATCEYNADVGVTIQLNSLLKPYLLDVKTYYEEYMYDCIKELGSANGIRLFEILMKDAFINYGPATKHITISVDELRECLGYEDKMTQFGHFNDRVIIPSCDDINENSMFYVEVEDYVKKGRKVIGIQFKFGMKYDNNVSGTPAVEGRKATKPRKKPKAAEKAAPGAEEVQQELPLESVEQPKKVRVTMGA